jgi:monofunctional biosynthetic peptidoglycan transglycosylase
MKGLRLQQKMAIGISRLIRWSKIGAAVMLLGSVGVVVALRFVPVYFTPLMLIRSAEQFLAGKQFRLAHKWVALPAISSNLALAVVCSEDQNFLRHHGFDFAAIAKAVDESGHNRKKVRGASTITQQTAKNVFLWPGRSWVRKGLEAYFTVLLELCWSKKRILEVYLNSIEMGEGIYGAEAAAGYYFKTSAQNLNRRQSAALAAVLPNPRVYKVHPQTSYMRDRVGWILKQMQHNDSMPLTR